MAAIISARNTCDGHRLTISTAGRQHTLHFLSAPSTADRDEAIKQFEQRLTNEIASEIVVETDELLAVDTVT